MSGCRSCSADCDVNLSQFCSIFHMWFVTQLLQEDIGRRKEKVQSLSDAADQFSQQNHFMASELNERAKRISERYLPVGFLAASYAFLTYDLVMAVINNSLCFRSSPECYKLQSSAIVMCRLYVTRLFCHKTVEAMITQFSLKSSKMS